MPLFQHPLPAGPRTLPESSLFCRLPPPLCCCLVAKSSLILCDPMDCSAPGSSIHGISQARILKWVAISFSRGIFPTQGLNLGLLHCRQCVCAKSLQSCPTLCDPVDCSPPGSSVHGILQARILEWVTMPFSRGPSRPGD